ncbi:Gfo/Idh/MocA family protein [Saccharothrix syringae]|uniref:Gfo/Idh/MocA family oxidoreductase n=1 Tax=Saccharothrix syringae TaxID=103733 RepID=A0A5Q0GQR8_SACSY|nr:Gfo/Idh/MocA family oxidoreductase [Saccharothrix syringae]QFZ16288.1 Gfo/Idh/MocA family oxidoreductase [Saccharothrix syringae]
MDDQLRVGLVGAGPWANQVHAPGIADHPGTRLTAVWARRPEAAAQLASAYGAAVATTTDELFEQVDAVAFAVPPGVQAPLAIEAAERGKHLVLEKPIASTLADAERLADAVARHGVASLVVLTRRFAPEIREQLDRLNETGGWVGGSARWLTGALLGGPFSHSAWRHERGPLDDVGPHAFDLLDAALGPITDVVAADVSERGLWQVVLRHEGGATSVATITMSLPLNPSISEISVYGEHGHRVLADRGTTALQCFANLLDDFVAMVDGGTAEHPLDVRRGLHLQRVLDLARRKAEGVA